MSLENIKKDRAKKLKKIKDAGINPYPSFFKKNQRIKDVISPFKKGRKVILAGRIITIRRHGGSLFLDLEDGTGRIQAFLKKDKLGENYNFFIENIDSGDFILFEGKMFLTKKGEKTIEVFKYEILAKSLLPLPEKWHGIQDIEERFRKRYLDLLMSSETKEIFVLRSKIVSEIRKILEEEGFLEVETPILQHVHGGAAATPFKTHHKSLDINLFLRIAPELYLKRLLVGGFDKVYEIGRVFRNEGIDKSHNPDFTMLEFYWAYINLEEMMDFCEKMIKLLVKNVFGKNKIKYQGKDINFTVPFRKINFYDLLEKKFKVDFRKISDIKIKEIANKFKIPTKEKSRFKILDDIFKKACREEILQPTFVLYQPIELTPLAKNFNRDPDLASRFQLIIGGWETVNAFSELNDPIDQKKRFEYEKLERKKGDKEAHPFDIDFIEALSYGMPPAVGFGMGIDRIVAILTDSKSLKEVILFPLMRPR
ncbi:MAG: lysine--tRNA ligase [Candidatus Pacebacteria bacterium]|nr:lysine--tRNA ligase [Candidatus Paceibacterota bacterium]